jgi:hypothetical protein
MEYEGIAVEAPVTTNPPAPDVKEGDQVMYVLENGVSAGQSRPAFVVRKWGAGHFVNLMVLTDCTNDFYSGSGAQGVLWATSVHYSATKEPRTWHYLSERK